MTHSYWLALHYPACYCLMLAIGSMEWITMFFLQCLCDVPAVCCWHIFETAEKSPQQQNNQCSHKLVKVAHRCQTITFTTIAVTSCAMTTHSLAADGTCMFLTSGFAAAVSGNFFLSVALLFCSLIQLEASLGNNSWIVFQRSHSLWNCFVQVPLQKKFAKRNCYSCLPPQHKLDLLLWWQIKQWSSPKNDILWNKMRLLMNKSNG